LTVSHVETLLRTRIDAVSKTISSQPLGLAHRRPETWADAAQCFENAARKASQAGGRIQFGWTFHHRLVERLPGPGYLFLTHHAVWNAPSGHLIDVTPYPAAKHRPIGPEGSILFLVDDKAKPFTNEKMIAPLPLRFFAIDEEDGMLKYVKRLNEEEQAACQALYAG
jgi:hypothetical protein